MISIVTAVLNRCDSVGRAIESLQAQSYVDFEHVVQDGGSSDGTLDVIRAQADHRTRLESEPDDGIYDALNRGIGRSTGGVIGLLHSDDTFASAEVLEKVLAAFKDPAVDGVYGDLVYVVGAGEGRVVRHWRAGRFDPARLRRGWMPPHPTLFLKREVYERWGLYDTRYRIAADYDAILRYLARGRIQLSYIPEVLVRMRVGGESNRSLGRIVQKSREDYRALKSNQVGGIGALAWKNLSKVGQFLLR